MLSRLVQLTLFLCFLFVIQPGYALHNAGEVKIRDLVTGQGAEVAPYSTVEVHYTGKLETGQIFDSSAGRAEPFTFVIGAGRVIQGWEIGIRGMKPGGKRQLTVPPELAYGAKGVGGVIPPHATLIFDIELISVINPAFDSISDSQLGEKLKQKVKLIDIRRPDEWKDTGVIEGSILITAFNSRGQFIPSFTESLTSAVSPDETFIVICRTGSRTAALSNWLATRAGYQGVLNHENGILSWISQGGAISKTFP